MCNCAYYAPAHVMQRAEGTLELTMSSTRHLSSFMRGLCRLTGAETHLPERGERLPILILY